MSYKDEQKAKATAILLIGKNLGATKMDALKILDKSLKECNVEEEAEKQFNEEMYIECLEILNKIYSDEVLQ